MKKLMANHKLTQKIFLSIIVVLLLSFTMPAKSQAGLGGILLDPLFDLVGTLLDVVTGALQAFLVDGEFNNSSDSSGLNFYLADKDDFMSKVDSEYKEFKYHTGSGEAEVFIDEDELDKSIFGNSTYAIPVMKYSPEKIFSGLIPALDINFVNPTDWNTSGNGEEMNERSVTIALHETIASWYVSLRNLAVVALMLVLVYVGIRIVISSTASDKAKYKQMLIDWLVALCILFCLHYIMTFTTTIVNEVTRAIVGSEQENGNNIAVEVSDGTKFNTDLMGLMRFKMQAPNVTSKILYLILYMAMVIYTCMFTFYYLRRVLTIAFLTLISPLVAMTYPIDKMRDGKAQAFDMWLKEYVFNCLLQPFHLIIYSIFVGSAIDLAVKNPLYAIIALAFITPAEKILRKFFGFEKASTAGALGAVASAAGGAALMNQMRTLMAPKKGGGGKSSSPRTRQRVEGDVPPLADAFGGGGNELVSEEDGRRLAEAYQRERASDDITTDEGTRFNLQDNEFRDNSSIIGGSNQGETSGDDLPEVASTDGMHMQGGLWVQNADPRITTTSSEEPSSGVSDSTPTPSQIRMHGDGAFQWSDDDKRGAFSYLGGGIARTVGNVATKIPGAGSAIRLGRKVSSTAKSIGEYQQAQRQKSREMMERDLAKIPKPIRNTASTIARTAKGVGTVAAKTGLAVGKAALKAAPGAMIGMAAGIAGDELGDIPKYTLAGAALSSTIGSSAVAQAGSFIADAYREGSGGNTPEAILKRQQEEFVKSKEWDDVFQQEFKNEDGSKLTKAQLKARKQQAAYYDSLGFHGEEAIKSVKLEDKIKKDIGQEQQEGFDLQGYTARVKKIAKDYSADKLRDPNKVKTLTSSLEKELINSGFDKKSAETQAAKTVKHIKWSKGLKE